MSDETEEYTPDPAGEWKRWSEEIRGALKWFRQFHKQGDKVINAFLDDRKAGDEEDFGAVGTRLNLFHSNIITLMSMLYGRIPKVEVARRFADADDDIGRVAADILTRMLNTDIEVAGEDIASVFRNGLQDRLLPGLGSARVQYQMTEEEQTTEAITDPVTGQELAPAVTETVVSDEWVDTVYTHWKDVIWSPARTYPEIRWKAYRAYLGKDKFKARFPKIPLDEINFTSKGPMSKTKGEKDDTNYPQVEVWEIWDKEKDCVYWWTDCYEKILDHKPDPLELEGFFPEPPPLTANITTSKFIPRSDYVIAQDLYRQIDELETRITMLTRACKLVGVYDKANEGVKRLLTEGLENDLIPVDNWAMFAEKQGLKGVIDWLPLEDIVNAIDKLTQKQSEKIQQLYQVTGMNDVMRGAASDARVSATQRKLEANYGSIRIEALQNEFARWVSDLQSLKAEIIAKHFTPETIMQQSNVASSMNAIDPAIVEQAIQLIKDPSKARWKITVRPETLAIADYAQLKQDRTEYINALSMFMQSAAPLLEMEPSSLPTLLKLLKWGMAGFRGSGEIEGVLDQAINNLEKKPPQDKPDPEAQKAQAEIQKLQMEQQADQQKHQLEIQQDREKHQQEMMQRQQEFMLKMEEMQKKFQLEMTQLFAKLQAQKVEQETQLVYNTAEREHEAALQVRSGEQELERDKQRAKIDKSKRTNGSS